MDKIQKQILRSLNHLLLVSPVNSKKSGELRDELLINNSLLLTDKENKEPCCDMKEKKDE